MKTLGPYFVPLHLNTAEMEELSPREAARVRLDHWRSMIARSRGMCGFRVPKGTGSKRKRPRNVKLNGSEITSPVNMILNGFAVVARYGAV